MTDPYHQIVEEAAVAAAMQGTVTLLCCCELTNHPPHIRAPQLHSRTRAGYRSAAYFNHMLAPRQRRLDHLARLQASHGAGTALRECPLGPSARTHTRMCCCRACPCATTQRDGKAMSECAAATALHRCHAVVPCAASCMPFRGAGTSTTCVSWATAALHAAFAAA